MKRRQQRKHKRRQHLMETEKRHKRACNEEEMEADKGLLGNEQIEKKVRREESEKTAEKVAEKKADDGDRKEQE